MTCEIIPITLRRTMVTSLWRGNIHGSERWSMAEILDLVSATYGVSVDLLKSPCTHRHITRPRQHAMWLMAQQRHLSLPMIGMFLGGRHHTTILHGRDAFAKRWAEFVQTAEAA